MGTVRRMKVNSPRHVLQLPPSCADRCGVKSFAGGRLDWTCFLTEHFEFLVLNSLMSAHIAPNWLWHRSLRIPPKSFLYSHWTRYRGWSASAGLQQHPFRRSSNDGPSLWANIHGTLTIQVFRTSMNLSRSNKSIHHFLLHRPTYVHNIRHFVLLLSGRHMADWRSWIVSLSGGQGTKHYPGHKFERKK
jgi:hypothetical protein